MSNIITTPDEATRFFDNITDLSEYTFDLVSNLFNSGVKIVNPSVVKLASCVVEGLDKDKLITGYIMHSYKHWNQIKDHNRYFFSKDGCDIFGKLPLNSVQAFRDLFTLKKEDGTHVVDGEDADILWEYFESLCKIGIKYIHNKRKNGVRFIPDLDLNLECKRFGVTLS